MQFRYDSEADALFVTLRTAEGGEGGGRRLDEKRIAHVDRAGSIFAYEFLGVSMGVSLEGIDAGDKDLIRDTLRPVGRLAVA